ncbi:MAG: RsmB/NOP family class I SAM-dependent RNA methyltransferase [Deltaproteobacteria bacterium]|nr:RsmB/NOP family class I SAM-dependent RNA methyltransferase [Deltaproteobacteria bacterium]
MRASLLRGLAAEALLCILERGQEADRVLERAMRRHRELTPAERAALARRVLGIACLRGRLDFRLDQATGTLWRSEPISYRLAAYVRLEELGSLEAAAEASGLASSALGGLDAPIRWPDEPITRLEAEQSLPRWLAERWHREFRDEARKLGEVSNRPGPVVLRANLLKTDPGRLQAALASEGIGSRPARWSPWGLELTGRANLLGSHAWREGLFEVQDDGSQLVALAVGARPGERIVDFCAGAGGKTLALAAAMENRGELLALDVDAQRLVNLTARCRRAGVTIARVRRLDAALPHPPADLALADRVLVDAPCSSLGTLRRSPDLRWRLRAEEIADFAKTQRQILERAASLVRPAGLLVYATCTLTLEENQGVAEAFSHAHPDWPPAPLSKDGPLRLLPHVHGTDGFFACAWHCPGQHLHHGPALPLLVNP